MGDAFKHRPDQAAIEREERPDQVSRPWRHRQQGPRARRGDEAVDEGLDLIGAVVADRNPVQTPLAADPLRFIQPNLPGPSLHVSLCLTRPQDNQFDLQLLTDPADQPLVIVGGGPEAVVHVECDQLPGAENQMEAEQQRDRIGPARNEHDTAIPF